MGAAVIIGIVTAIVASSGCRTDVSNDSVVVRIEVTPGSVLLTEIGQTIALEATAYNAANSMVDVDVDWSSSHPELVTVTPEGIESGIEELERLEAQIASESNSTQSETPDVEPASGDSIVSRLGPGMLEHMPDSDPGPRDGDKLVSCRLGASTHFMRAGDCSMRGGDSTVIKHER